MGISDALHLGFGFFGHPNAAPAWPALRLGRPRPAWPRTAAFPCSAFDTGYVRSALYTGSPVGSRRVAFNTRTRLRAILARALNSLVWLFPRHGACEHSVHLTIVSNSNSAPSLRLPGLLHCPEGFRPLAAARECSGASRQTPASVEYLRRHAGLGQDSNPAKQSGIQLHVARALRG